MEKDWDPSARHSEPSRWVCIYPVYINSRKTLAQGRKLNRKKCVENPTAHEIFDVLVATGFNALIENKLHPRERSKEMVYYGRVRVQLKQDDGTPVKPEFPTRDSLLLHVGTTIPQLKTRQGKQAFGDQTSQSSASSSKKGKGKGRR